MKKLNILTLAILIISGVSLDAVPEKPDNPSLTQEKYQIMKRDQIDNTDTYAIPLDDSEIEDEEEVNRAEKKEVFALPQSPNR